MTSSNVPFESSNPDAEAAEFLGFNLEALSGLAAFVDLSEGFTLGFVETNFARSTDWIVAALKHHPHCQAAQIETVALGDPNLRSLLEELQRIVPTISRLPDKKLVLVVSGLERAIGILGDYTPFVATLNFERDMLAAQIPHPVILVLPDYAMTRIARYAVDFWSWSSGRFRFGADRGQVEVMRSQVWDPTGRLSSDLAPVKRERIALLEQLLMDCAPSGREVAAADVGNCLRILLELGDSYRSLANYPTARAYYQRALELAQEQGKRQREADALLNLGRALPWWNQALQAREYYEAAMEIYRQVGDRLGEANTLQVIGDVLQFLDQRSDALNRYEAAMEIYRQVGARLGEANTLQAIGDVLQFLKQSRDALNRYEAAMEIYRQVGDRLGEANTLKAIGDVLQFLKQSRDALNRYEAAMEIYRQVGARLGEANTLKAIGDVLQFLDQRSDALNRYEAAMEIYRQVGARLGEANTLKAIGDVLQFLDQRSDALNRYEAAMEIYRQVGDRLGEANALDSLALASFAAGNYQQALDFHQQALDIFNLIESRYDIAWSLRYLGRTQLKLGDPLTAINFFEQAKSLFENLGMTETANACQQEIQQINQNSNPSAGSVPDI